MANLLNISDEDFNTATSLVTESAGMPLREGDQIVRSYVYLGTNQKIADYGDANSDGKYQIAQAVNRRVRDYYSSPYPLGDVQNLLNELTRQAMQGLIDQRIAFPRKWTDRLSVAIDESHKDTAVKHPESIIQAGITDFFGVVRSSVESALRGLGFSVPLPVLIALALIVMAVIFHLQKRGVYAS